MKLLKILLVIALFVVVPPALPQTAITTDGTVDNGYKYKTTNYEGTLSGTDTLTFSSTNLEDCTNIFNIQYILTSETDSALVTIKRQESYFAGHWSDYKTIVSSEDTTLQKCVTDTLVTYPALGMRLVLIGESGNGYTTGFKVKIVCKKE